MYSTNRMNLICVYKSRESRLFMKPILLKLVNTLRQNSTQESFICDIKLFGSGIGFTMHSASVVEMLTFLIAMITTSCPGYLLCHADFIT